MKVITKISDQEYDKNKQSIFLAGPSYRSTEPISGWRKEFVDIFRDRIFDGTLFVPEPLIGIDEVIATEWEDRYMKECDLILFWIPRDMKTLPGLTTNIEFGRWMDSGKCVVGHPYSADNMEYIDYRCKQLNIPLTYGRDDLVRISMKKLNINRI